MSCIVALPSPRTSAIDRSTVPRLMPRPTVRFACASMSTHRTWKPCSASDPARLMAVVVLPTPPFWFAIAMTFATVASPHLSSLARSRGMVDCTTPMTGYPQADRVVHRFCGQSPPLDEARSLTHPASFDAGSMIPLGRGSRRSRASDATRRTIRDAAGTPRAIEARRRRAAHRAAARARQAHGARATGPAARSGSFVEFDAFVLHRATDFGLADQRYLGDGVVTGHGTIDGRGSSSSSARTSRSSADRSRGARREDLQDHGPGDEGRRADRRPQRFRRRAHPGRRRVARRLRRHLPAQHPGVRRGARRSR